MPSVIDARMRASVGIDNAPIRDRVTHDLSELEIALTNGDAARARFYVRVVGSLLVDYRAAKSSANTDGADVSAISLSLREVSMIVDAGYEFADVQ